MTRRRAQASARRSIDSVLADHTDELLSLPGLVGAGIGRRDGAPCLKVYVQQHSESLDEAVPTTLEGYEVIVEEIGPVRALDPG